MISRHSQARTANLERNQRRLDAGIMSRHYPEVAGIVINMMYKQQGIANPIQRVLNFSPGSYAFFKVDCLSHDCVDGGFDMSWIVTSMIRNRSELSKGELECDDSGPRPDHSKIVYEIAIQYV
jgi:hypothetical protein